jgi:hypothetical protein
MVDLKFASLHWRTRVLLVHYYRHQQCQLATWQKRRQPQESPARFQGRGFPLTARRILQQVASFPPVGTPCVVHAGRSAQPLRNRDVHRNRFRW